MSFADKARKILKEMKTDSEESELRPLPYFEADGGLVIPFGSDPRFHYWSGGQSIADTEEEVRGWRH